MCCICVYRDNGGSLSLDEFSRALRRDAKLTTDIFSDKAMSQLFIELDTDKSGIYLYIYI